MASERGIVRGRQTQTQREGEKQREPERTREKEIKEGQGEGTLSCNGIQWSLCTILVEDLGFSSTE